MSCDAMEGAGRTPAAIPGLFGVPWRLRPFQRLMPSKLAAMPRANSDQSKPSASAR